MLWVQINPFFLGIIYQIYSLGRFVTEEPRMSSIKFGAIWTLDVININTFLINS